MYPRPKPVARLGIPGQSWPALQPLNLGGPHPQPAHVACAQATVNLVPSRTAEKQFDCHLQGDTKGVLWLSQKGKLRLRERA